MTKNPSSDATLPKGIHRSWKLPDKSLGDLWDSIVMDEAIKNSCCHKRSSTSRCAPRWSARYSPARRDLVGRPAGDWEDLLGTGLGASCGRIFSSAKFRLLEVEPHTLTSSAMGKTQRAVADLFSQSIAESAAAGPTIVLLDEVETLAADRAKLSLKPTRLMCTGPPTRCWCSWTCWPNATRICCSWPPATSHRPSTVPSYLVATW